MKALTSNLIGAVVSMIAVCVAGAPNAAEIRVMSSAPFKAPYEKLTPQFEKASGHKVLTQWAPPAQIISRIRAGDVTDLIIMSRASIEILVKDGKIVSGSLTDLAKSGVGVAVRTGAPKPDISSANAVREAVLKAKSIAYSAATSGNYIAGLFERMGIAGQLKPKIRLAKGEPVGALVARGEAELGFQQISELLPVAGIDLVGPLPSEIQEITVFSAGLHASAQQVDAAQALVKFLRAPNATPVIRQSGMEPG